MKNAFSSFHPFVQFFFFLSATTITTLIMQPVMLFISLLSVIVYYVYLDRSRALRTIFCYIVPMCLLVALINPLFNHAGITVLFYLPDGNAFTLEAVFYGALSGLLLGAVIMWCGVCFKNMDSERVIYLFGRISPSVALLITMIMRFIPKLSHHFRAVRTARASIGKDITSGNVFIRLKNLISIIAATIQWSAENSLDTADSMKSRGYGLKGRTSFSVYKLYIRDVLLLVFTLVCDGLIVIYDCLGVLSFEFYPETDAISFSPRIIILYTVFFVFCIVPFLTDVTEELKWRSLRSAR